MFDFDLNSVLEQPTVVRSEVLEPEADPTEQSFSGLEFDDFPDEENLEQDEEKVSIPFDAEAAAENLVSLLAAGNLLLTPLANWKLKKKRGGKAGISVLQVAYVKSLGVGADKMTDLEKKQLTIYMAYLRDKEELEKAIPFTDEEIAKLTRLAVPYCKATKFSVSAGSGFWTTYGMMQFQRVIAILQA